MKFLRRSSFLNCLLCVVLACMMGCNEGNSKSVFDSEQERDRETVGIQSTLPKAVKSTPATESKKSSVIVEVTPTIVADKKIPEILWEERTLYELEGQEVWFTDCGLYKGDSDKLMGAKCEYKNGEWVLLEPTLEPKDNLIENGDFTHWNQKRTMPVGFRHSNGEEVISNISQEEHDVFSDPYALRWSTIVPGSNNFFLHNLRLSKDEYHENKFFTFQGTFKLLTNARDSNFPVQILDYNGETWDYVMKLRPVFENLNGWTFIIYSFKLRENASEIRLQCRFLFKGEMLLDNLYLVCGNLPMKIKIN